jgi:hypothetical protein
MMRSITRTGLVLFLLLVPTSAMAKVRPGVEVGLASVWLSDALDFVGRSPNWRLDMNGAVTVDVDLKGTWSLNTGLRYTRLGNQFDHDGANDPSGQGKAGKATNLHQYLGVPVLFRWDVPGDTVFLFGGSEFAWLVKAASETEFDDGSGNSGEIEYTDAMNRFNLSLVGGLGTAVAVGDHLVEFTGRYGHSLLKSNENDLSLGWKTREFALTAGFRW